MSLRPGRTTIERRMLYNRHEIACWNHLVMEINSRELGYSRLTSVDFLVDR